MIRGFLIASVALAALAAPGTAQERLSDERIRHLVEDGLDRKDIRPADLEIGVADGEVTLSGTVDNAWQKQRAVEIVMDIAAVRALDNGLEVARAESDDALRQEIADKLANYAFYTIYDEVNLAVQDGNVVLTGRVTMPFKAKAMGDMAARVFGVQGVANEIQTLSVSIHDDRIRQELATRLYGDSLFYDYAFWANPPIHIVVENGNVTLTGRVRSRLERIRAEHIARGTGGVFRVENRLQVGDGR